MAIRDWPEDERPREKLLLRGPASLSDAELLAVFLRTGVRGKTAVSLARELLRHFGGLTPLLDAARKDLSAASGIVDSAPVIRARWSSGPDGVAT